MAEYDGLRRHLRDRQTSPCMVSFEEVAVLVPGGLPSSAYNHLAWWSNRDSRSEAAAWLAAGWRTESGELVSAQSDLRHLGRAWRHRVALLTSAARPTVGMGEVNRDVLTGRLAARQAVKCGLVRVHDA